MKSYAISTVVLVTILAIVIILVAAGARYFLVFANSNGVKHPIHFLIHHTMPSSFDAQEWKLERNSE